MKPKLLLFAPPHFQIDQIILENIVALNQYEITTLSNHEYKYKNLSQRLKNLIFKTFLKKNLKTKFQSKDKLKELTNKSFDKALIIRPDLLHNTVLKEINKITKTSIALYWDSFSKIPEQVLTLDYFHLKFSFDKNDCELYNLKINHNFYIKSQTVVKPNYDAVYFGSYDKRLEDLNKILNALSCTNKNVKAFIFKKRGKIVNKNPLISIFNNKTPFSEAIKYTEMTNVVIDLAHKNQIGLSMRPFEALGLNKKLITTNKEILNTDFYNPNNILLIDNVDKIQIPDVFFTTPFQEIDSKIKEKYHIKNWLKNILD